MPVVDVTGADPSPCEVVQARDIRDRRRAKLGVFTEESSYFECVEIADKALASAPVVTIALVRNEVPPKSHLGLHRGPQFLENVLAPDGLSGLPTEANVLIGISIVASVWQIIVGIQRAI